MIMNWLEEVLEAALAAVLDRLVPVPVRMDHRRGYLVFEGSVRSLPGPGTAPAVVGSARRNRRILAVHLGPSFADIRCRVLASTMQLPRDGIQR